MESPTSAASRVDFYGFLDRMRRPEAAGLFRSIKSFLTSISLDEPSTEADGARVQAFFTEMEAAIRGHPLWAEATHQEIDHALEPRRRTRPPTPRSRTRSASCSALSGPITSTYPRSSTTRLPGCIGDNKKAWKTGHCRALKIKLTERKKDLETLPLARSFGGGDPCDGDSLQQFWFRQWWCYTATAPMMATHWLAWLPPLALAVIVKLSLGYNHFR
ncbi:uncharacterized protein LOC119277890 isoform X1 [Triticum dicoccoides]|uniref:uncharacterized protein LOC119277890 isoform X1 n=1 Tax=Triticum dicoccoides TaxID=85692 RepID=UPI00188EABB5|nr:uncharacterized protein LOC119277890 isoform X1 [Triticum dicoccoides]